MQTKLTLRLEDELINKAKVLAQKRGKSLSKLVAEYFEYITSKEPESDETLPPIVKSLSGSLAGSKVDESEYKRYLESKHL
ncbi:MAG: antitoxin [Calditrichaeota bacterium]|nr:MAG: antitoxin [Calditrichota bacterium]